MHPTAQHSTATPQHNTKESNEISKPPTALSYEIHPSLQTQSVSCPAAYPILRCTALHQYVKNAASLHPRSLSRWLAGLRVCFTPHRYRYTYTYTYTHQVKSSQVKSSRDNPPRRRFRARARVRVRGVLYTRFKTTNPYHPSIASFQFSHSQCNSFPLCNEDRHRHIHTCTNAENKRIQMRSYIEAPLRSLARDETASSALRSGDAGFRGAGERKRDPIWTRLCS